MSSSAQRRAFLLGGLILALGACHRADRFWPALPPPADPRTIAACSFCPTAAATDFERVARGLDEIRDLSLSPDGRHLLAVRMERHGRLPVSRRSAVVLIDLAEGTVSPIFQPGQGSVYGPTWVAGTSDVVALWTTRSKLGARKYRAQWVRIHAGVALGPPSAASPASAAPVAPGKGGLVRTIVDRAAPPFKVVSETSTDLGPAALAPDGC